MASGGLIVNRLNIYYAMSHITQKCEYGLRALFELALRKPENRVVAVAEIAEAQAIPPRFLELILNQLKQTGIVMSRRGQQGGYMLAVEPHEVSVGDVIRYIDGPLLPDKCTGEERGDCPLRCRCVFTGLWAKARDAVATVYDSTTLQDLVEQYRTKQGRTPDYAI